MAKRNSTYQEKTNPILTVIYLVALVFLIAVIVIMYRNYKIRQRDYKTLVAEAAVTDSVNDIASMKSNGASADAKSASGQSVGSAEASGAATGETTKAASKADAKATDDKNTKAAKTKG